MGLDANIYVLEKYVKDLDIFELDYIAHFDLWYGRNEWDIHYTMLRVAKKFNLEFIDEGWYLTYDSVKYLLKMIVKLASLYKLDSLAFSYFIEALRSLDTKLIAVYKYVR